MKKNPRKYICYRTDSPLIIDGNLDKPQWKNAPLTEEFTDIEGSHKSTPPQSTRVKMLWDDNYLYIGAHLEEKDIWATFTDHNSAVFQENCFEVFIDPTGDTHNYFELQINALGTIWDILLTKPYRDGGIGFSGWNIPNLKKGIKIKGSINDPSQKDSFWTVELAIPWYILREAAPNRNKPRDGDQWRINFARVNWQLEVKDGEYSKVTDPISGESLPEYNQVWAPHGAINMHMPEMFGYIQFSDIVAGEGQAVFNSNTDHDTQLYLRRLYHQQHEYKKIKGEFASTLEKLKQALELEADDILADFDVAKTRFMLSMPSGDGKNIWHITEDGRIWKTEKQK